MILEIKHLASYLQYGLELKLFREEYKSIYKEYSINSYSDYPISFKVSESVQYAAMLSEIKPILIPLSELKYYSNGIMHLGYRTDENNFHNLISDIKNGIAEYKLIQMCFEEHIDVFGLIEAGLAIDKNTLTNQELTKGL